MMDESYRLHITMWVAAITISHEESIAKPGVRAAYRSLAGLVPSLEVPVALDLDLDQVFGVGFDTQRPI
jgi:hypothetical protein